MKKVIFLIVALCICNMVFPQDPEKVNTESRVNEIKLFVSNLRILGIGYERLLAKNAGLGFAFEPSFRWHHWGIFTYGEHDFHFRITSYSRYYFKTFFIEADAALSNLHIGNKFSFGISLGCKFINKAGYFGELLLGGGTYFENMKSGYWRFGLGVGKQFN